MLYDPKWEKPNPNSIHSLIGWLETKNATDSYTYNSPGNCLLAQYFSAQYDAKVVVGTRSGTIFRAAKHDWGFWRTMAATMFHTFDARPAVTEFEFPRIFNAIAIDGGRTFGGALARAKAYAWEYV